MLTADYLHPDDMAAAVALYILQISWQFRFGMFVFEVLFVRFGVWHLGFTHRTGEHQGLLGSFHLVAQSVTLLFLHLGSLFLSLLLGLDFLMSTGHFFAGGKGEEENMADLRSLVSEKGCRMTNTPTLYTKQCT